VLDFNTITLTWIGIALCITQSAIFSGLNLAMFSLSRLRLETEADSGDRDAIKVLAIRRDSNFLLTTILWGNVSINVLLALLSDSIMTGVGAFIFSTVVITIFGEIAPQAYFSRNALRVASLLAPLLRFYQFIFFPIAKPCALILDWWLGREGIQYLREHNLREFIKKHIEANDVDIDRLEGLGALNFLSIDDLPVVAEGEPIDPKSIIQLSIRDGRPAFPEFNRTPDDPFLQQVQSSGKPWVIITDTDNTPWYALDADAFLRRTLFAGTDIHPLNYCHRPILIADSKTRLGTVMSQLTMDTKRLDDNVIDHDVIVLWGESKHIITGSDILGRLMSGIAIHEN
jgi:hypothetical protein